MRVTNSMMVNTLMRNISNSLRQMDKTQSMASSGKRINRASDDPVGVSYALRLRTNLEETAQFKKNIGDGLSWLDATDSALENIGEALHRLKELTVNAGNGTNNDASRQAIKEEILQLKDHIQNGANTTLAGRYIFSGTKVDTPTYAAGAWQGDANPRSYEVGVGIKLPINVTADQVFSEVDAAGNEVDSVFKAIDKLVADIDSGDTAAITSNLSAIEKWTDKNLSIRAEVGARVNRLELTEIRLEDVELNFTKLLSDTEDADMAKVLVDLKTQESVYRAALGAGAQIIQPTLIDFLR